MLFFVLFIVVPLIEISLFIVVGDEIGLFPTLLLCVLTAAVGAVLVREQGLRTLFSAKKSLNNNMLPVDELFDGICLALAGVLLMTPGFFTDALGFSLLAPPVRRWLRAQLTMRFWGDADARPSGAYRDDSLIIDAEFEYVDDDDDRENEP